MKTTDERIAMRKRAVEELDKARREFLAEDLRVRRMAMEHLGGKNYCDPTPRNLFYARQSRWQALWEAWDQAFKRLENVSYNRKPHTSAGVSDW